MTQIFYFCGHEQFQPETLVQHAILAEQVGFDGVFVSEHFNPWVADISAAGFALSTLGAIASQTKKVRLMTGVITPLFRYHPAVVAQAAATIDRLSNGRFMLGVGTGESINEAALGYNYPSYKERSERMKEALEIMKKLFSGEKLSYSGTYYQTKNVKLYSPPLHTISIFLAAGGPKTATLAANYADGIIVSVKNPQETQEKIITPAKQQNKSLQITASRWTIFAKNEEEAWHAVQPWRGLRAPHRDTATDPEELQKEADSLPREEIVKRYTLIKSPEDYINTYRPLIKDLKADIVAIQTTSAGKQEDLIKLLGEKVLPALKNI